MSETEPGTAVAVQSEPAATALAVIERAARDPSVDVQKLEKLLAMQERILDRQAESAFNQAMTLAQADMTRIAADAENPQTHSRYATYAALDRALRPIYSRHGFALSFDEAPCDRPEFVRVLCHVSHRDGHTRTYTADIPADGKGPKGNDVMSKTHAVGAAKSYGMRYLLKGIFNVAVGEEDNDGNTGLPTLDEKQQADLLALLTETGADVPAFKRWAKVKELGEILAKNFEYVCREIRAAAKQRQEAQARREARA